MYGLSNTYLPITMEDILARVSEETVFLLVFDSVVLDKKKLYRAPYREDNSPKCYFEVGRNGRLHFVDFADPYRIRKDCFGLIEACYSLSKLDALRYIDQQLGLGISNGEKIVATKVVKEATVYVEDLKQRKRIDYAPRPFDFRDRGFWYDRYGITRENLKEDGVFPTSYYRFEAKNGKVYDVRPNDICYTYTEFTEQKKKIYRPMGSSEEKWLTNCNQNDIGGVSHIDYTKDYIIITKSYKDYRVLKNEGLNVIWFQNEGMVPDRETLDYYKILLFKTIYIWFDNDSTGLAASTKVRDTLASYNSRLMCFCIVIPIPLRKQYNVKDPADFREYSHQKFHKFITEKIISHGKIHS